MILIFFSFYFSRLPPKSITYRSVRCFETKDFLYKLENKLCTKECNGKLKYDDLTNIFKSTLENHTSPKQKLVRRNQAPFMTKGLSKDLGLRTNTLNGHPERTS